MTELTPADITNRWFKIIGVLALLILGVTQTPLLGWLADVQAGATISSGTYLDASPVSQSLEDNLIAHWTFDGPDINWNDTSSEIKDIGANNNHGNATSAMTAQASTIRGPVGQALQFNGVTDFVNLGSDSSIDNIFASSDNSATIVFWAYIDDADGDITETQYLINKRSTQGWSIYMNAVSDRLTFRVHTYGQPGTWSIDVPFNQWFQVTIAYDRSQDANRPDIYLDGILQSEIQDNNSSGNIFPDDPGNLFFGRDGGSFSGYLKGALDDVRIYDNFFIAEQAKYLYDSTKPTIIATTPPSTGSLEDGLVGHWTFDGPDINWASTTAEIRDIGSGGNHGDAINIGQDSVLPGRIGQALNIRESDKRVSLGDSPDLEFGLPATISVWLKPAPNSDINTIFHTDKWDSDGYGGIVMQLSPSNLVSVGYGDGGGASEASRRNLSSSGSSLPVGEWSHVVAVIEGSSDMSIYIDGVLNPNQVYSGSGGSVAYTSSSAGIGSASNPANASMDDLRLYNRVLSAGEVSRLYQQGGGVTLKPCGVFTVTDVDGNEYDTVQIGGQCWMAENMRVGTRIDFPDTSQTDNGTIEKYCFDNNDSNCSTDHPNYPDGGLYQWDEAMQYSTTEGAQGICPDGWHIPTDQEWKNLEIFLGMDPAVVDDTGHRGSDQGAQLKPNGSSGFEGNLAGHSSGATFYWRNTNGYYWSSSESGSNAWFRFLVSGSAQVRREAWEQSQGMSVRCLQD